MAAEVADTTDVVVWIRVGVLVAGCVGLLALTLRRVAEALEGIHACGIVHRDLKPSTIVLAESGPRVIDFGLAPEQLTGGPLTPAVDAYAFGMVLCQTCGSPSRSARPDQAPTVTAPEG